MPATMGGQWTILASICAVAAFAGVILKKILRIMVRLYQLADVALKVILFVCRRNPDIFPDVPDWINAEYKKINGNENLSSKQKSDLFGHDSGELVQDENGKWRAARPGE